MWRIGVVVFDGVDEVGVSGAMEIWAAANTLAQRGRRRAPQLLEARMCTAHAYRTVDTAKGGSLEAQSHLGNLPTCEVLWFPSGDVWSVLGNASVHKHLHLARGQAEIVVGVGAGCGVLAGAGLLRGTVALDEEVAAEVRRLDVDVRSDPDATYVDQGDLMTATASGATDLALHLVARAHSKQLAVRVARTLGLEWQDTHGAVVPPLAGEGII